MRETFRGVRLAGRWYLTARQFSGRTCALTRIVGCSPACRVRYGTAAGVARVPDPGPPPAAQVRERVRRSSRDVRFGIRRPSSVAAAVRGVAGAAGSGPAVCRAAAGGAPTVLSYSGTPGRPVAVVAGKAATVSVVTSVSVRSVTAR
ncbi:hypothetical protein Sm713_12420 [Streptomyces sp. TS71-3]|nr:hypothetical protein Sm713_12420 [Streptomyces sp. TS71-3]